MGAGSAGASRVLLESAFDLVTLAKHGGSTDLEWRSVIE